MRSDVRSRPGALAPAPPGHNVARGNQAIVDVVDEWFDQALVETVFGCQTLQGERDWSPNDIDSVLSEKALTATAMRRSHVANALKRTHGAKIGSLRERTGAV
jgi:hypothetical protein